MGEHHEKINNTFVVAHPRGHLEVDTSRDSVVIHLPHLDNTSGAHHLNIKKISHDTNKITLVGNRCKINDDHDIIGYSLRNGGTVNLKYLGNKWVTLNS